MARWHQSQNAVIAIIPRVPRVYRVIGWHLLRPGRYANSAGTETSTRCRLLEATVAALQALEPENTDLHQN